MKVYGSCIFKPIIQRLCTINPCVSSVSYSGVSVRTKIGGSGRLYLLNLEEDIVLGVIGDR